MEEVTSKVITFKQLKNSDYTLGKDTYDIASEVLDEYKIKVALSCPSIESDEAPAYYFETVDGVVAGRIQLLATRVKLGDKIEPCGSASALEVAEPFRKLALGLDIMSFFSFSVPYQYVIVSGLSGMALPLYKILKYKILEFPKIMFLNNSRCVLESKGIKGFILKIVSAFVNIPFGILKFKINSESNKLKKEFIIKEEKIVPTWVDDIVLNDGHKYMEVHDHKWMQWNLDHNLNGQARDKQWFYSIYRANRPVGFFMTKERYRETAGGILHNVLIGSIVEWGVVDGSLLSETEVYSLAFSTFNSDLDIIETATSDNSVVKKMKKKGFIPHGFAHIGFMDTTKRYKDAEDINLWRARYGYADVILT